MRRFVSAKGSLVDRLATALSSNPLLSLSYNAKEAAFTATTENSRAVAALIVAIEYK